MAVVVRARSLLYFGIFAGFYHVLSAIEVTLLDTMHTRNGGFLRWQTFTRTQADDETETVGWREGSTNLFNGDTIRIYSVCNVHLNNVDNWLRTPYISRGDAHRLYVEMRFTIRKCTKHPDQDKLQQCKENFQLYYYEAESDFANDNMPTWDTDTFQHADVVAADQVFTNQYDYVVNTEVRSVPITRRGVYFAFHDQGACTSLQSVRIFYKICPTVTLNFAMFPNTTAGPELSSIEQSKGTCVNHAAIERQPSYLCKADGSWYLLNGGCKCMPGYEPEGNQNCTACPNGKYKWRTGSYACSDCPSHSEGPHEGSVECHCVQGYYRNINDDKSAPCTRPPSPVRDLEVTYMDQSMVNVSWNHPEDLGGRRDITYSIECSGCMGSEIYYPTKSGFNTTKAALIGLSPKARYKIIIVASNGVSRQSGIVSSKSVVVTTKPAIPTKVQNLRVVAVGQQFISIAWESAGDRRMEAYEVRHYPKHNKSNVTTTRTNRENHTFTDLPKHTKFLFEVRGKTARGWGEFSNPVSATTGIMHDNTVEHTVNEKKRDSQTVAIIATSVGLVGLCMFIVIIITVIFCRRNHRPCHDKNVSDCDTLQYSNVQCPPVLDIQPNGLTVPLFSPPGTIKTYIDPHTYEDPNQAVREFTKEIDASFITIESVIGGGEFGDVCKGKLKMIGRNELTVAIKTLKAGASDKNRLDFLTEASIMGQFEDPNVIYLEGVVTKSNPIMIVTEYMENGSLDTFLRTNDGKFTMHQLVGMMRGIASGMNYLSEMGYVHRDLAARNILTNDRLVCKVADFGLSREIEADTTEGAYTTKGGKIPVRWTAPEAISYRKFTSASDVWSYGVVMWEVMSYGERPYWNWSNQDVIKHVDKGFRLPPPMDCPEAIHQLMLDCWQRERSHRPKFSAIVKTLDKLIRAPELLRKVAKPRQHNFLDTNSPDLISYESIEDWLTSIKMERYTDHFLQAGITSMEHVAQVTLKDLTTLGVTLVGHQKKIMNSVQTLRAQMCGAQVSEGFLV